MAREGLMDDTGHGVYECGRCDDENCIWFDKVEEEEEEDEM